MSALDELPVDELCEYCGRLQLDCECKNEKSRNRASPVAVSAHAVAVSPGRDRDPGRNTGISRRHVYVENVFDDVACDHDGSQKNFSGYWNKIKQRFNPLYVHMCKFCGKCPRCVRECKSSE